MEIIKDIPAQIAVAHTIDAMVINIPNKTALCLVKVPNSPVAVHITVDVMPILLAGTDAQRTIIRGFFKKIIAEAMGVLETEVPAIFD